VAVTTTVQDILTGAYGRSTKNVPNLLANEATELLKMVTRALRGLYAYAARVNPTFFAESAAVPFASGGWPRPQTAESIFRLELASLQEVVVVPFDDRLAEPAEPAVYEVGQKFFPATLSAPNPQSGNIIFWYSRTPAVPAGLGSTLDAQWTEQFNDLLMLEVAIYLALKDGRAAELGALQAERDNWIKLFVAFLEHATANERGRFSQVRRFTTKTLVPIRSLLAGEGS
jgi:hypothetical protein